MQTTLTGSAEPLTEQQIDDAEQALRRAIPPAYRKFLMSHNGARPDPSDFTMTDVPTGREELGTVKRFLGIGLAEPTLNLDYVLETFKERIPPRLFPFARDPGGNLICISMEGVDAGKIWFWDHEREAKEGEPPREDNLYLVADSFDGFLDKLGAS